MAESIGFAIKGTADIGDVMYKLDGMITKMEKTAGEQTKLATSAEDATKRVSRAREEQRRVNGLLVNSEGKVVEGLAKWRVAAGQYLDAQGEIVDQNGRSIRGLTVLQQKMKMYRDEQGRVCDANDKVVQGLGLLDQKLSDVDKALGLEYDDLGRLVKTVQVDGEDVVRFYDELTDAQKKAGLFADEYGRIFKDLGDKGVKNLRKYTATAEEALKNQREFQMQLMEGQSILAQLGEDANSQWIRYFATYQKVMASIGNDLLARGGATATFMTMFRGMKDNWATLKEDASTFRKTFVVAFGEAETKSNGIFKNVEKIYKAAKGNIGTVGSSLFSFAAPFLSIGATALPELIKLFGLFTEWQKELVERPYKGLSDELKEIRIQAEKAGKAIRGAFDPDKDVAIAVSGLLKTSFTSDLQKLEKAFNEAKEEYEQLDKYLKELNKKAEEVDRGNVYGLGQFEYFDPDAMSRQIEAKERYNEAYSKFSTEVAKQADALLDQLKLESERLDDELKDLYTLETHLTRIAEDNPDDLDAIKRLMGIRRLIKEKTAAQLAAVEKERQGLDTSAKEAQARAEKLRAAGIDGFLKAQDDAKVSFETFASTVKQWEKLVKEGVLTQEELDQATEKARDAVRQGLESELGVKWREEASGITAQMEKLNVALKNQAITEEEQASALSQLRKKELDALAQSLGLELDAREELTKTYQDAAKGAADAFIEGRIGLEEYNKLFAAAERRRVAGLRSLADETGVDYDALSNPGAKDAAPKFTLEAAKTYKEAAEKWKKALDASEIEQESYDAAIEQLKARAYAQAQEGWNGKDADKQLEELNELYRAEIITEAKFLTSKKELAAQVEAAAKKQRLENLRSELGVDSIMESLKTPAARLKETMDKLAEAQKEGVISEKELAAVRSKAYQEYLDATQERGVEETLTKIKPEAKAKDKSDKTTAGESLSQGSESLYKAMLKRRAPTAYETKMQSAADRMCEYEALNYRNGLEQTDRLDVIANGFQALGNIRVFG